MNAILSLTERERAEIRKQEFEFYRAQPLIVLEAMGELFDWHAALVIDDDFELRKQIDKVLDLYLERCGKYRDAEQDALSSKSVNGARYLEA